MTQGTTKGVPIDTDATMALNSNQVVPSQAAVVTYVGAKFSPMTAGVSTITGSISMNGGMIQKRTPTAISYTVLVTDVIVAVTSTTAARTITMPNAGLVSGQRWTIKDESGGAAINAITIAGNGATIDGVANQVMNTNYGSVDIYCNGTNFFLV